MAKRLVTAREHEAGKTRRERAQDVAYTVNHSIVCAATDCIDPYLGHVIQRKLGNDAQLKDSVIAEIAGDVLAVPFTVGMQRMFPGVMRGIAHGIEAVAGPVVHKSAERATKHWAREHGIAKDSPCLKAHADRIYQYEIEHSPQAVVWTASSVALNLTAQRLLGNEAPLTHIFVGKAGGAVLTGLVTVGARTVAPKKVEKWDRFIGDTLIVPVMRWLVPDGQSTPRAK